MMGWYHGEMGWDGWIVMTLAMVIFWALVIFAVVAIFRGTKTAAGDGSAPEDPMDILDQRFARGEIDEQEYHARQAILRASVH